jgi:hypothetical protein
MVAQATQATPSAQTDERVFELRPLGSNIAEFPVRLQARVRVVPRLERMTINPTTQSPIADSLAAIVNSLLVANANADIEAIGRLWAPGEREALRRKYQDQAYRDRNSNYARSATERYLIGEIFYGSYSLAVIAQRMKDGRLTPLILPFLRSEGTYYATNQLESDGVYVFMSRQIGLQLLTEVLARNPNLSRDVRQ